MSVGIDNVMGYSASSTAVKNDEKVVDKKDAAQKNEAAKKEDAVVYEKSGAAAKPATYSINKMSATDRAAIVEQMKQDQMNRESQLANLVKDMLSKQAGTQKIADMFSPENLKNVSAADIAKAKEDISEDGYWGVKQTSQRLFDFASALAGDDVEKMKQMQEAMEKGFKLAAKAWGDELPDISKDTMNAANKLFEDYYASKNVEA